MTSKDTTGSKLIASMRRTKAAASGEVAKPSAEPEAVKAAPAKTAAKPVAKEPVKRTPKRAVTKASASKPEVDAARSDPFQTRRRVWPD